MFLVLKSKKKADATEHVPPKKGRDKPCSYIQYTGFPREYSGPAELERLCATFDL